ncbi:MAG TPA: TetR/AcrR family transcriptional regulator [Patescibacteria group bacterium]|nr:TetR/AcrR family transcriptional regulator [Patescibacteria group bacterium]
MAADPSGERHVGRPRRAAIDAAIIRATVELMTEGGVDATSLTAVARRAGVARATVYLRWPTRSALVGAAARAAVGGQVLPLTGDVEADVRVAAGWLRRVFELPSTPAILPEIIRGVLANPPELSFDAVAPRRNEFARLYTQGAGAAGFDPGIDPYLPFDILLGTALVHLFATRRAMTPYEAERLAEVVIRGLRTGGPENDRAAG